MSAQRSLTAFGTWYSVATCRLQISEKEGREGVGIGELECRTADREGCGRGAFLLPLEVKGNGSESTEEEGLPRGDEAGETAGPLPEPKGF
uniref:Uncharacterized protein n=1 Tax=Amphimedon queenslandica TaxID=400682 RepID=A0A1X7VSU0_AMPQE